MLDRFETRKKDDPAQQDDQERAVVPAEYPKLFHFLFFLSIFRFPLINQVFGFFIDRDCGNFDNERSNLKIEGVSHAYLPESAKNQRFDFLLVYPVFIIVPVVSFDRHARIGSRK
jgi:hypothetical protein